MSSKGGDTSPVSPVRVSRLKKKRRRPIKECPLLQTLPATMKQKSRQALVDGNSKANILNHGLPSILSGRQSLGKAGRGGCAMVGKDEGLGTTTVIALRRGAEDSSLQFAKGETIIDGERSSLKTCTNTATKSPCYDHLKSKIISTLEFMDHMDPSALLSAIPSMLGIDNAIMMRYQSCAADFQKELERAFECHVNHADDNDNNNPRTTNSHDISPRNERIYHSIVGRIDCPNMVRDLEERSIDFPRCNISNLQQHPLEDDATTRKEKNFEHHAILQHLNLRRKTGHGMRIPLACYQFPLPETSRCTSPDISLVNNCEEDGQQQQQQPAKLNVEERSAAEEHLPSSESILENKEDDDGQFFVIRDQTANNHPPMTQMFSVHSDDDDDMRSPNGYEKEMPSRSSKSPRTSLNYKGEIKIISGRGATIREVSDLDQSYQVIGKLREGDERYFIEKRKLLPPPIEVDGSDDESYVDCMPVIRYKIVLNPTDGSAPDQFMEKVSGQMVSVGWISDRGRWADDAYSILQEI